MPVGVGSVDLLELPDGLAAIGKEQSRMRPLPRFFVSEFGPTTTKTLRLALVAPARYTHLRSFTARRAQVPSSDAA
jgi:hypothetical protein